MSFLDSSGSMGDGNQLKTLNEAIAILAKSAGPYFVGINNVHPSDLMVPDGVDVVNAETATVQESRDFFQRVIDQVGPTTVLCYPTGLAPSFDGYSMVLRTRLIWLSA